MPTQCNIRKKYLYVRIFGIFKKMVYCYLQQVALLEKLPFDMCMDLTGAGGLHESISVMTII